jgi:hypothetical protein
MHVKRRMVVVVDALKPDLPYLRVGNCTELERDTPTAVFLPINSREGQPQAALVDPFASHRLPLTSTLNDRVPI